MKRKSTIILFITVLIILIPVIFSLTMQANPSAGFNTIHTYMNGSKLNIDTLIYNQEVYVPIDAICSYLGCSYEIDEQKVIHIAKDSDKEKISEESYRNTKKANVTVSGTDYWIMIDGFISFLTPVAYEDTLYIHLKHLVEFFDMSMKWGFLKKSVSMEKYPEEYVGTVNGEKIKARAFHERYCSRLANLVITDQAISDEQKKSLQEEAFSEVVELVLAAQIAAENGITVDADTKDTVNWYLESTVSNFDGIEEFRKTIEKHGVTYPDAINYFTYGVLLEKLKEKTTEGIIPGDDILQEYYLTNRQAYVNPSKAIVQHIIIPAKDENENSYSDEKVEQQRALAEKVLERIRAGEDFEALQKEFSVDYFSDTADYPDGFEVVEGQLAIAKGFEQVVFALEVGEISDIVKTYRGFHIIKLLSKTDGGRQPFEQAKGKIAEELAYSVKTNRFNEFMEIWKEESVIEKAFD